MKQSTKKTWLKAAAVYNILYGALCVLFPALLFDLLQLEQPRYPEFWQCIGMIVGVYGLGYWLAARDYVRHWPIVAVGFLGKVFGPLGFVYALATGRFPLAFAWIILCNDLIWWPSFYSMLKEAWREHRFQI